jgi:hypothetical protein
MAIITHETVFRTCSEMEPGFTYNEVESVLGLGRNRLQRLFEGRGFRKLGAGKYALASRNFEDWCVLAGLATAEDGDLRRKGISPTGIPDWLPDNISKFNATEISFACTMVREFTWESIVAMLSNPTPYSDDDLKYMRGVMTFAAMLCDHALNDPRYKSAPETIWESRLL